MFGMKPFRYLCKPIRVLLIINLVVFLAGMLFGPTIENKILAYGGLIPLGFAEVWRFVTYAFIHGGFWHFLFNMMMLWMFGDEVAENIGERKFLILYLGSAIFAGLFSIPFYLFGALNPYALIIGASGALMGVFVAYYKLFPERMLLMFFVIPMKIKHAIWILILMDILLSRTNDSVAHFTHLGGVVAGFIIMALFEKSRKRFSFKRSSKKKTFLGDDVLEGEVSYIDPDKQLDEILKKVKEEGLQSLTDSERAYILKMSDRINRRRG
jgi:membrane associated rhomboid family serine protease